MTRGEECSAAGQAMFRAVQPICEGALIGDITDAMGNVIAAALSQATKARGGDLVEALTHVDAVARDIAAAIVTNWRER